MGVWSLGSYGLHHDRTDPSLLSSYSKVLPGYDLDLDVVGSPYAVVNYTCSQVLCPLVDDLLAFRRRLHDCGIALFLDFVPNHAAVDSDLMSESADLFVRQAPGLSPDPARFLPQSRVAYGTCYGCSPWTDVGQLNYWNPETRKRMISSLLAIAEVADGVRCDMAYLVLNDLFHLTWAKELDGNGWRRPETEFWQDAVRVVKSRFPGVVFVAEVYGQDNARALEKQGFDFTYDKDLLDKLKWGDNSGVREWIKGASASGTLARGVHFVENHDEDRAAAVFGSPERAAAAAAAALTLPGMRFLFQDQAKGYRNKLDVHLLRSADEPEVPGSVSFFNALMSVLRLDVMRRGKWNWVSHSGSSCDSGVSWRWALGSSKVLVAVNLGSTVASCQLVLPDAVGSGNVTIHELIADVSYERYAPDMRGAGLWVILAPYQSQAFAYP